MAAATSPITSRGQTGVSEPLPDSVCQVHAIKDGNVLIADFVLLKNISWCDLEVQGICDNPAIALKKEEKEVKIKKPMRLPTCSRWNHLAKLTKKEDDLMHWDGIYTWCQDDNPNWPSSHTIRGYHSVRTWTNYSATNRAAQVGFRPAIEVLDPDALGSDGALITVGTLYMEDEPVKIPANPIYNGDIADYVPGAKLEMREALPDSTYQVKAFKVGDVLIADRVLLKNISWNDLVALGICGSTTSMEIKEEKNMKNCKMIVYRDGDAGGFVVTCSRENEEKVRAFIEKRYPTWAAKCEGKVGIAPLNYVMEAVEDMRELLGDESLELVSGCAFVQLSRKS